MDSLVEELQDLEYLRSNYSTLERLSSHAGIDANKAREDIAAGRRPKASYVAIDGTEYFPHDYFLHEVDREQFTCRLRQKAATLGVTYTPEEIDEAWSAHMSGTFGVCLWEVTPENIVVKRRLIEQIEGLLARAKPENTEWSNDLRSTVEALDELERPFCDYDRQYFSPLSRDKYVRDVRAGFPQVFEAQAQRAESSCAPQLERAAGDRLVVADG